MAIRFEKLTRGSLLEFTADAPGGAWIGLVGHGPSGISDLLDAAAGQAVTIPMLSALDLPQRMEALASAEKARREGQTVIAYSPDPELLRPLADEVWWLSDGRLRAKGDPGEVIGAYIREVIEQAKAAQPASGLHPSLRRGDGRAEILAVEVLDENGHPCAVIASGAQATVRVRVRYQANVEDPVVGIMIRTRIGFEVYGTNTELERVALGPVMAGESRTVDFRFACQLCPQSYTVTAASHDPNGVWHEWMEDAVSFAVADTRYTAGVANLRAQVERILE